MWFTEDPWPPMLVCGLAALLAIGWWSSSKRVIALVASVGCLLLGASIYVIEGAIVTPAEEVEQLVADLCGRFQRKDPQVVEYVSANSPQISGMLLLGMAMVTVGDDLRLTDFQTTVTNENSRATCHFRANATITVDGAGNVGRQPGRFRLIWAREGDEWKLNGVKRLNPVRDEEMNLLERAPS